jgi:hypothetical protein
MKQNKPTAQPCTSKLVVFKAKSDPKKTVTPRKKVTGTPKTSR